jgi:prevent-host-death family protein
MTTSVEATMATTRLSSRDFNQSTGRAKRAARRGPVIITERGRAAYVLLTVEAYQRLTNARGSLLDVLGLPKGVEDIPIEIPWLPDPVRRAPTL